MLSPSARLVPLTGPHTSLTERSLNLLQMAFPSLHTASDYYLSTLKMKLTMITFAAVVGSANAWYTPGGTEYDPSNECMVDCVSPIYTLDCARSHSLYVRLTPTTTHTHTLFPFLPLHPSLASAHLFPFSSRNMFDHQHTRASSTTTTPRRCLIALPAVQRIALPDLPPR